MTHQSATQPREVDVRREADLLEILSEVDSRVHRVMERFIDAGARAKSEMASMIDDAVQSRRAEDEALARELESVRAQLESVRTAPAQPHRRPAAEAIALVEGVRLQEESGLSPIRKAVDQLHSIESSVAGLLSPSARPSGTLHVHVTVLGLGSYQEAISLAHAIKDDHHVRDVNIQSYQPGRLLFMVVGADEAAIAQQVMAASSTSLMRLPDQANSLVFQVAG